MAVAERGSPVEAITLDPLAGRVDEPASGTAATSEPGRSWLVSVAAMVLSAAVLVTSLAMWRTVDDGRTLARNQAQAASAGRAIVEKMLGYDYKTFDKHTTEVSALLTGGFKDEFVQAATSTVKPLAVQNQAVVVAEASEVAVMSTPDQDTVTILAFVNQTTSSVKLDRPQIDQNRVILTLTQAGGRWLVSEVAAF